VISLYEEEYIIRLFVPYSNSLRDLAIWETLILLLSMLYPFVFIALSYLFLKPVNDNDIEFADMPGVMKAVLYHPYAETYPQLFPYIKAVWFLSIVSAFFGCNTLFCLFGFVSMLLIGVFQSMADIPDWDYVWLVSNTVAMEFVAFYFLYELIVRKNQLKPEYLHKNRLWMLVFFPFLFWYPVATTPDACTWDFSLNSLLFSKGGTCFCYVSPTLLAVLLMYYPHVNRRLVGVLSMVCSLVGLGAVALFGIYKMYSVVVMHIPLLVISFYGHYLYFFGNEKEEKEKEKEE
jgi:membrane protein